MALCVFGHFFTSRSLVVVVKVAETTLVTRVSTVGESAGVSEFTGTVLSESVARHVWYSLVLIFDQFDL